METIHPSFSFPAFLFLFFVLFLRRGVHINKKVSLFSSLFYSTKMKRQSCTSYVTFLHPLSNLFPKSSLEIFSNPCHCQTLSFKSNSQNQMDYSSFLSLAQPQLPLPFPPPSPLWVLTATAEHHRSNEIGRCTL